MAAFIRRIVSGPKTRHVDDELHTDLDLAYITDRLIIMGWPASSFAALYRNRRKDVRRFLNERHGGKYRIYNLCPCDENSYDPDEFEDRVSRYPFPDHHPPPLSLIAMMVTDITAWLARDPENIAVIHCKAGKGRSGTMACCYLLSLPTLPPPPQDPRKLGLRKKALQEAERSQLGTPESSAQTPASSLMEKVPRTALDARQNGCAKFPTSYSPNNLSPVSMSSANMLAAPSSAPGEHSKRSHSILPLSSAGVPAADLSSRLQSVFELHTSRRLRPKDTQSPLKASANDAFLDQGIIGADSSDDRAISQPDLLSSAASRGPGPGSGPGPRRMSRMRSMASSMNLRRPSASTNKDSNRRASFARSEAARPSFARSEAARPSFAMPEAARASFAKSEAARPSFAGLDSARPRLQGSDLSAKERKARLQALGVKPSGRSFADLSDTKSPSVADLSSSMLPTQELALPDMTAANLNSREPSMDYNNSNVTSTPRILYSTYRKPCHAAGTHRGISNSHRDGSPAVTASGTLSPGNEQDVETQKVQKDTIPRWAVSIPSQRRFVGYWARILAGEDPRPSMSSEFQGVGRRTVRIMRITIDRQISDRSATPIEGQSDAKKQNELPRDALSVQLVRYDPAFEARVSKWEKGARQRARAFGAVDPSAPAPELKTSPVGSTAGKEGSDKKERKAPRDVLDEECWKQVEDHNSGGRKTYERNLAQHGNDIGVGCWGVNILAEADRVRNIDWGDAGGSLPKNARKSEQHRANGLSDASDGLPKLEYLATIREEGYGSHEGEPALVDPTESNGLSSARRSSVDLLRGMLSPTGPEGRKSESGSRNRMERSKSGGGEAREHFSTHEGRMLVRHQFLPGDARTTTPGTPGMPTWAREVLDGVGSPGRTAGRSQANGASVTSDSDTPGIIVDADAALMIKVLSGRSGASHSRLPDMASCGYLWFVPSFETPKNLESPSPESLSSEQEEERQPHQHQQPRTSPHPFRGQRVQCTFGLGEIDFRKGQRVAKLLGGEVRSVSVEWEWVETGVDEEDDM